MRNQRWGTRALACALAAVMLTACGGGGDDNGGSTDLSGWWDVENRPGGSSKAYLLFTIIQADEAGSSFWVNGTEFTRTGNQLVSYDPSATDEDREVITLTIVSANQLEGTIERYERDLLEETTDLRVQRRTQPAGTFSMTGTVAGNAAAESSTTAYGSHHDGSVISEFGIFHVVPYERETHVTVRVEETPVQTRTYTVGTGAGTIEADVAIPEAEEEATSGTVTITSVGTRLIGTYDLTLPGGAVTGSFDVPILLDKMP